MPRVNTPHKKMVATAKALASGSIFGPAPIRLRKDLRNISVSLDRRLILKKPGHLKLAERYYAYLRKVNIKSFRVLPIKSVAYKGTYKDTSLRWGVQRYFKRPSVTALVSYLSYMEQGVSGPLRERAKQMVEAKYYPNIDEAIELHYFGLSKEEVDCCKSLLSRCPGIKLSQIKTVENELREQFHDAPKNVREDVRYDSSNYIVFGLTREGLPKIGVVDL